MPVTLARISAALSYLNFSAAAALATRVWHPASAVATIHAPFMSLPSHWERAGLPLVLLSRRAA